MRSGFGLLLALFLSISGCGQRLVLKGTSIDIHRNDSCDSSVAMVRFRYCHGLEYSLLFSNMLFLNLQEWNNSGLVSFSNRLKYHSQITNDRRFRISNSFLHELGIQYYIDSIVRFQPDENTLDTRIEITIVRKLTFSFFSTLTTRMFNSYHFANDLSGNPVKVSGAGFLTPLLWTFSAGFGWNFLRQGNLSMGLSSAKITWIRSREVSAHQNIPVFYGVPREKSHIFEYGFSVHLLIDQEFLDRLQWSCDLLVFKNHRKSPDLVLKNLIGFRISKILKAGIQTRVCYEKEVSERVQVENILSMGICFNP